MIQEVVTNVATGAVDSSLTLEVVAAIASTMTSAVLATVALVFSYRQNVGWKPIAFQSGAALKGLDGEFCIVLTIEFWNRRRYPTVIRRVGMVASGVTILDQTQDSGDYIKSGRLRREVNKPIGPGEHLRMDLEVKFRDQSLDAMQAAFDVKVYYFDPYRGKNKYITFNHEFFYPDLGWKLSEVERKEITDRYEQRHAAPALAEG